MLGDAVEAALERFGVTKTRVERWLGSPCGCEERQLKLNQLHAWFVRAASGKDAAERSVAYLESMTEDE